VLGAVIAGNDPTNGTFAASVNCVASECANGFGVIGVESAWNKVIDIAGNAVAGHGVNAEKGGVGIEGEVECIVGSGEAVGRRDQEVFYSLGRVEVGGEVVAGLVELAGCKVLDWGIVAEGCCAHGVNAEQS